MRQVAKSDDERRDDDSHQQAPGHVRETQALVRRERRNREIRLVQPAPSRDAGEDDRSGSRGDEAGKERAPYLLRRDLPACGRHLEQEKCRD